MFDGTYLFDAGWVFFAIWSLILVAFFLITFGEELFGDSETRSETTAKKTQNAMRSPTPRLP